MGIIDWLFKPTKPPAPVVVYAAPDPPANPADGMLWWDTDDLILAVRHHGQWIATTHTHEDEEPADG